MVSRYTQATLGSHTSSLLLLLLVALFIISFEFPPPRPHHPPAEHLQCHVMQLCTTRDEASNLRHIIKRGIAKEHADTLPVKTKSAGDHCGTVYAAPKLTKALPT